MSDLPLVSIHDLAEVNPPVGHLALEPAEDVSFLGMSDVSEEGRLLSKQIRQLGDVGAGYTPFREGDVLFAKITPCMENGKGAHVTGLVNGVGFGSTEFHVLRARDNASDRFVFFWTQSVSLRLKAAAVMTGSAGQRRVPASFFREFMVPNLPLAEQQRIAEILDTVDEAIRKTEEVIAKLQQMKQGLLHDLLTRGIDDNGELRDPDRHPEQFKPSELGRIPRDWDMRLVGGLADYVIDGTHFTPTYVDSGVPFLRVTDLHQSEIDPLATKHISEGEHRALVARCCPRHGDILLSKNGTVGIPRVVDWDWVFSFFVSLALIRPIQKCINSEYFGMVLGSFVVQEQIRRRSKQGTVVNLHLEEIREFRIPLPSLKEQGLIIIAQQEWERWGARESATLAKLRQLKSGLMDDLLTGRIRTTPPEPTP